MLAVSRPTRPEFALRATPRGGNGKRNGDRDATTAPPPTRQRRPGRLRARCRRRLRRAVRHRMPTVPAAGDRLGRTVAVPVLRLGGLLGHVTTPAHQSPLRSKPTTPSPSPCRAAHIPGG